MKRENLVKEAVLGIFKFGERKISETKGKELMIKFYRRKYTEGESSFKRIKKEGGCYKKRERRVYSRN